MESGKEYRIFVLTNSLRPHMHVLKGQNNTMIPTLCMSDAFLYAPSKKPINVAQNTVLFKTGKRLKNVFHLLKIFSFLNVNHFLYKNMVTENIRLVLSTFCFHKNETQSPSRKISVLIISA